MITDAFACGCEFVTKSIREPRERTLTWQPCPKHEDWKMGMFHFDVEPDGLSISLRVAGAERPLHAWMASLIEHEDAT